MKKLIVVLALLLSATGYLYLQTGTPSPKLAAFMPGGAMLCIESPNFRQLLSDWDSSKAKADWLASANYLPSNKTMLMMRSGPR